MSNRRPGRSKVHYSVFTAILVVSVAAVFVYLVLSAESIDPISGCADSASSRRYTFAFLIDSSDKFSPVQLQKIKNKVEQIVTATAQPDRIQIYTNAVAGELAEPIFDMCAPFSNQSEAPALARFRSNEFNILVDNAFDLNFGNDNSPIIQSMDAVSLAMPNDGTEKILFLVSDLYENSQIFNHYNSNWEDQAERNRNTIAATMPDLRNVNVHLLMIARPELNQGQELIEWWVNYLGNAGASFNRTRITNDKQSMEIDAAERITG